VCRAGAARGGARGARGGGGGPPKKGVSPPGGTGCQNCAKKGVFGGKKGQKWGILGSKMHILCTCENIFQNFHFFHFFGVA